MENKFLLELSIKYGLDTSQLSKLTDVLYQVGFTDLESREFKRAANFVCEMNLVDMPSEELVEELKRKGLI